MPNPTVQAIKALNQAEKSTGSLLTPADETMIAEWMHEMLLALKDLALGHCIQETRMTEDGIVQRIYVVPPDFKALQYLTERVLGRTPQKHEITGKDGGAIQIIPMMPKDLAISEGLWKADKDRLQLPSGKSDD